MRARRNHQNARGFRFLWVLNYVPIIRHFHRYVHVPEHENDVPDAEEASQSEQQVHNPNPTANVEEELMEREVRLTLQKE